MSEACDDSLADRIGHERENNGCRHPGFFERADRRRRQRDGDIRFFFGDPRDESFETIEVAFAAEQLDGGGVMVFISQLS